MVKVGQVWKDNDKRIDIYGERFVTVLEVNETFAICNSERNKRIRKVRIKLSRFKPNSTGYVLIQEAK
ncbi:MAG: hypothetical protein FWB73_00215 [Treponema sp.]|nr:hypothetical protein [Treponema sp.]